MPITRIEQIFTDVVDHILSSKFRCHHGRFDKVALKSIFILVDDSIESGDTIGCYNSMDFLFSVLELAYRDVYYQNIDDGYDNWHHEGSLAASAMKTKLDPYISKCNARSEIVTIQKLMNRSLPNEMKDRFNVLERILVGYEQLNLIYEQIRDK